MGRLTSGTFYNLPAGERLLGIKQVTLDAIVFHTVTTVTGPPKPGTPGHAGLHLVEKYGE